MNEVNIKKKNDQVIEAGKIIQNYEIFLILEYSSLSASEISVLRQQLNAVGALMCVFKNNILSRAFNTLNITGYKEFLIGQNAIVFGNDLALIRLVNNAIAEKSLAKIKAGRLHEEFFNTERLLRIASLGNKNDLIVQFLLLMQSPLRKFLSVLTAVKKSKEKV